MKFYKDIKDITTVYNDAIKRHNVGIEDHVLTHSIITDPKAALLGSFKYTLLWNICPQKSKLSEIFGKIYVFISYNPEVFLKLLQHLETYTELEF